MNLREYYLDIGARVNKKLATFFDYLNMKPAISAGKTEFSRTLKFKSSIRNLGSLKPTVEKAINTVLADELTSRTTFVVSCAHDELTDELLWEFSIVGFPHDPDGKNIWVDLSGSLNSESACIFHPVKEFYVSDITKLNDVLKKMTIPEDKYQLPQKEAKLCESEIKKDLKDLRDKITNLCTKCSEYRDGGDYFSDDHIAIVLDRGNKYCDMYDDEDLVEAMMEDDLIEFSEKFKAVLSDTKDMISESKHYKNSVVDFDIHEKGHFSIVVSFRKS